MSTNAPIANLYTWLEKASAYTDGSFGWSKAACSRTQHNIEPLYGYPRSSFSSRFFCKSSFFQEDLRFSD